jgi:hypothetical protein
MLSNQGSRRAVIGLLCAFSALGLLGTATGCARRRTRIVAPPNELRVYNQTRKPVAGIRWKPCRSSDEQYAWIPGSAIEPGSSFGIPVSSGCLDLSAVSAGGKELGRQFDVELIPGSVWQLR